MRRPRGKCWRCGGAIEDVVFERDHRGDSHPMNAYGEYLCPDKLAVEAGALAKRLVQVMTEQTLEGRLQWEMRPGEPPAGYHARQGFYQIGPDQTLRVDGVLLGAPDDKLFKAVHEQAGQNQIIDQMAAMNRAFHNLGHTLGGDSSQETGDES